ncbi:MAG: M14 family metallopeptidase [Candidatus Paceibacterota bacterium]|jgi:uncharacterized protein YneF (UPF0154 family)
MKNTIIALVIIIIIVIFGFALYQGGFFNQAPVDNQLENPDLTGNATSTATSTPAEAEAMGPEKVIGQSAEGRDIVAYSYGEGDKEVVFVGGVHGGYSWNTVLATREIKKYFEDNQEKIPANLKVTIIPLLNPDGLNKVIGTTGEFDSGNVPASVEETVSGRFNANGVDLNRNFDCNWQETSTWRNQKVNAGTKPFSEPEAQAFRNYINEAKPAAVVFYFSAAGGVFSSSCQDGILPETKELTSVYAKASGYPAYSEFDFYDISGDAVNWLAKEKIPGISVLLSNHQDTEWSKNRKGIEALLNYYAD